MPIWNGSTGGGITEAQAETAAAAAIAAANLPSSADVEAACDASIVSANLPTAAEVATAVGDSWGTVQFVQSQYFNAILGNLTGELIAAPGAGFRIEILSWRVGTFAGNPNFEWSSGATLNLDTGPQVSPRTVTVGGNVSHTAVSPFYPLYVLAENANFGITMGDNDEIVVDVQYRIVAV